jgi:hypothetical protein
VAALSVSSGLAGGGSRLLVSMACCGRQGRWSIGGGEGRARWIGGRIYRVVTTDSRPAQAPRRVLGSRARSGSANHLPVPMGIVRASLRRVLMLATDPGWADPRPVKRLLSASLKPWRYVVWTDETPNF